MSIPEKIHQINALSSFKSHYLKSDLTLEVKATSFLGRLVQWFKKTCNPKLYKTEHVFKTLITHISFNPDSIDLKSVKFTDLTSRLKNADERGCTLLKQNTKALKVYEVACLALFRTSPLSKIPQIKILRTALEAKGYSENMSSEIAKSLATHKNFTTFVTQEQDHQKVGDYLFQLAEDITNAHIRKSQTNSSSVYSISKGFDEFYVGGQNGDDNFKLRQALNDIFQNSAPGFTQTLKAHQELWMAKGPHLQERFL